MRLPDNVSRRALALGMMTALGACASGSEATLPLASMGTSSEAAQGFGPAADYPSVLGDPYVVDGKQYVPVDTTSYDEVGYATNDAEGGAGITAAHKTLPLPSYVEITSLETGQTILARIERRGPMTGDRLVALSPGARAQLGGSEGAPVRVRRVNPPEVERAKLRMGQAAPLRMETPASLVAVLKRKLPERGSAPLVSPAQVAHNNNDLPAAAKPAAPAKDAGFEKAFTPTPKAPPANYALKPLDGAPGVAVPTAPKVAAAPMVREPARPAKPAASVEKATGEFVIQAAAFSSKASADRAASKLGGFVKQAGKFYRVRVGPYTSRGQANAALAKVRAAGYSDAKVFAEG